MARDTARVSEDPTTDREEILAILAEQIRDVRDRIAERDDETEGDEHLSIKWIRTLGYLSGQYRKLMKDTDIDEMEEDLELLYRVTDLRDGDR